MQTGRLREICMGSSSTGELFDLSSFNNSGSLPAENLSSYFICQTEMCKDEGEAHWGPRGGLGSEGNNNR